MIFRPRCVNGQETHPSCLGAQLGWTFGGKALNQALLFLWQFPNVPIILTQELQGLRHWPTSGHRQRFPSDPGISAVYKLD